MLAAGCWLLSSPMKRVRSFPENLSLSGLAVLPSVSAVMSSPSSRKRVCAGTDSLLIVVPSVSFWPPASLCANRLGYDSETSFSRAFKRIIGHPPSEARYAAGDFA